LDYFIDEDDGDIATRLVSFRNLPLNDIRDRQTKTTDAIVSALLSIDEFFNTFRAYFPVTVASSSDDDIDSPRSRRRRRRRTRVRELRQGQENANKRLRRH
jgi:hypothetical protein